MSLTFKEFRAANLARQHFFKGRLGQPANSLTWSPERWVTALVGEVGELANIIKKVFRGDLTLEEARPALSEEVGDIQTYHDLLTWSLGLDTEDSTIHKWNKDSERIGYEGRIGPKETTHIAHIADDGTVRQQHYGSGKQPWDTIVEQGWGPAFAAGNILKYLRRDKEHAHSIESAKWYYARIQENRFKSAAWYEVYQKLLEELSPYELQNLKQ